MSKCLMVPVLFALVVACSGEEAVQEGQVNAQETVVNHFRDTVLIVEAQRASNVQIEIPSALKVSDGTQLDVEYWLPDGTIYHWDTVSVDGGNILIPLAPIRDTEKLTTVNLKLGESYLGGVDTYPTQRLPEVPVDQAEAVLLNENGIMMVNMDRVSPESPTDGVPIHDPSHGASFPRSEVGVLEQALSNCGNALWGPGVGRFQSSKPGAELGGQRFSYCAESVPALNWPVQGDFAIDAIYRQSWGCTQALKVPNNCTAIVSTTASISYCCSFPSAPTPTWINPTADMYFPDCPLTL